MTAHRRVNVLIGVLLIGLANLGFSQTSTISYKTKCEVCHGTAGLADTPEAKHLHVLPFNDPSIVAKSDAELSATIQNGSGKMPSFKNRITDAELNNLIRYIRQVQNR